MTENDNCSGCAQKHDCKSIYQTLGHAGSETVFWKVVFIFLVPIAAFIISIAVFGALLHERLASETVRTIVTVLLAAGMAVAAAWIIRLVNPGWTRPSCQGRNGKTENGNTRKNDI